MSNGVKIFPNMRSCIFLIILLGFIDIIFCSQPENVTEDVCPVKWFRRKRAVEYTRWKSNMKTTPEFIVKVLDDEMTTRAGNQILAVNVMPNTNRIEKIIVGGVEIPKPTTISTTLLREYTRFKPPTTVSDSVQNLAMTPPVHPANTRLHIIPPYLPSHPTRNAYRDESPPNSPQFLPRARPQHTMLPRQYAPIAPVTFSLQTTIAPIMPSTHKPYDLYPTRSSTPSRSLTRTAISEIPIFKTFVHDKFENFDNNMVSTRTALTDVTQQSQSWRKDMFYDDDFEHNMPSSVIPVVEVGRNLQQIAQDELSETDEKELGQNRLDDDKNTNFNDMFLYNPDDKDGNSNIQSRNRFGDKTTEENVFKTRDENFLEDNTQANTISLDVSASTLSLVENKTTADEQYSANTFESTIYENSTDQSKIRFREKVVSRDRRRPVCNMIELREFNFIRTWTLPEIVNQLQQLAEDSPLVEVDDITGGNLTTMENPIHIVKIDDPMLGGQIASAKQNVLLVAGVHGRDHIAVASAMHVLLELIEKTNYHRDLLVQYRFWIIPVFNPDGYDYSVTFPHRRNWIKNLRHLWDPCKGRESCQFCTSYGLRCTVSPCYGVNLDRNFEYQWIPASELHAEHPCGYLYAGSRQMSEVETLSLSNYLYRYHITMAMFIALKEGSELGVMYPYSHTKKRRAFDQIYRDRARRAAASANRIMDRHYVYGQTSEFLPIYAGGIEDWADAHLGIDNTYTIMMFRPTDPMNILEAVKHEVFAAMDSLLLTSNRPDQRRLTAASSSSRHIISVPILLSSLLISHYYT